MLGLPWFNVDEWIQKVREIVMLEWICHLRPTHLPWEAREAPSLSSVIALLLRPDLSVGTEVTELGNRNAWE